MRPTDRVRSAGFTLVEMIMTLVILAIIGSMVAVFIQAPVRGYVDTVARAELVDVADTVLRRLTRDLRIALPNSVRVSPDGRTVEMLLTRTGGRYLNAEDPAAASAPALDFLRETNTSFTVVGDMPTGRQAIAAGDRIVVMNLGPGMSPADAYTGGNSATVASVNAASNLVNLVANPFALQNPPMPSPSSRFQVVSGAVRYVCVPGANGSGTLTRHSGYAIGTPVNSAPAGGVSALAANWVTACNFNYSTLANVRAALVVLTISMQKPNSTDAPVNLTHQVHVDNSP